MKIINLTTNHVDEIIELAHTTWFHTYSSIISQEQIRYMLDLFYNASVLHSQLQESTHIFKAVESEGKLIAYMHLLPDTQDYKLSKLYVLPSFQGRGAGALLMQEAYQLLKKSGVEKLTLNVNRFNPAFHFYVKHGFEVIHEVDIPLGDFYLNDYVMQKIL